jgi:SAM-dependent methyltransferase
VDRDTISAITHGDLPFASPLSGAAVDAAIAGLKLPPGATAIDVGCGNGEVLARVKRHHHDVTTMGIEPSHRWADIAHEQVDIVHTAPLERVAPMEGTWDLVVCIASSHAYGSWLDALHGLRRLARPGAYGLVGEGFWRRRPTASYLELLGGAREDELPDRERLRAGVSAAGWQIVDERVASDEDWAAYEETLIANGERHVAEHAHASELRAWVEAARARWNHPDGRDTLGFALLTLRAAP